MKFPLVNYLTRSFVSRIFVLILLAVGMTLSSTAQKSLAPENDSASLEQCRNGATASPVDCTGSAWVTGNAGSSNSHWEEKQFISYRMLFGGLAAGTSTVTIGYDRIHSAKNAIDYLGSYNYTNLGANPCSGVTGIGYTCSVATDTEPTPHEALLDSHVPPIPQIAGVFTFFGATFNSVPVFVPCGVADETLVRCVKIDFTPNAGVTNPVLSWGGHIGWRGEWGAGQSAGGISGSPYHMRLEALNGQGGNQDRSLSANAVLGPASLRIIKAVTTFGGGTSSTVQFFFTASTGFSPSLNFDLVDDDAGAGVDAKLSDSFSLLTGQTQVIVVNELTSMFPLGQNWSLGFISCTESVTTTGTTISNPLARVTLTLNPEEVAVCTFNNTQLSPSAAPASVSGRAVDSFGNGIGGARVSVMDAQSGAISTAITNPFGYYTVDSLEVGNFYVMTISHKRFVFADDTRTFSLQEDLVGVDFIANP